MCQFSPQLIDEITSYFQEKYEVTLTPGQAEEYLNSWADLWNVVACGCGGGRQAPPEPPTTPVIFI